jgi:hypothetical protein
LKERDMTTTIDTSIENWRIDQGAVAPGRHKVRIPLHVQAESVVTVSASEYGGIPDGDVELAVLGNIRFMGDADVWVSNIAAHGTAGAGNGAVEFVLHCWENYRGDDGRTIGVVVDVTRLHSSQSTHDDSALTGPVQFL